MLSFVGLYFLLLGSFVYNFYLSKKMYSLLTSIGGVLTLYSTVKDTQPDSMKGGTMKKLLREGIELQLKP